MSKISKRTLFELLLIIILGLTPLLWFKGGEIILGHDAGTPLNPIGHFLDRLYVWTGRWGLGSDQSVEIGAFFIHGLEAAVSALGATLQQQQKITFIFWFLLPGLTMYYFTRSVFSDRKYLPLIASVFFMFNHFLLQGWFVAERTKFSTYAAMPIILLIIFKLFGNKISPLKAGIFTAITLAVLNGGGNLPLFGSLFVLMPIVIIYFLFLYFSRSLLRKSIVYLLLTGVFTVFLSAFWLLPYLYFVLNQFSTEVEKAGGIDGVLGWAKVISANTSFLNLLRLQGIPDWYSNSFHPYAIPFLRNPFLIAVSFVFPILAFGSWFIIRNLRERVYILLFMLIALVGIFFAAGVHPPTGFLYELMLRFAPGFMIFRTPFYKFAPLVWLSFSILIAFSIDEILRRSETLKFASNLRWQKFILPFIIIGIILYNFPFLDGRFFDFDRGRSTRISVPSYIFDFGKWADSQENKNIKSLLLPPLRGDNKIETYSWGYFSLTPITVLLSRETFVINATANTRVEERIINGIYENLLNNKKGWEKLSAMLGIKNFIVQGDYKWNAPPAITRNPKDYENTLKRSSSVKLDKVFGEWKLYSFEKEFINPLISAAKHISFSESDPSFLKDLAALPSFDQHSPFYFNNQNKIINKDRDFYLSKADSSYYVPKCVTCDLANYPVETKTKNPVLLPGSPFYKLVVNREKQLRAQAKEIDKRIEFLLTISYRRLLEARIMLESKTNLESLDQPLRDHFNLMVELDSLLTSPENFNSEEGNDLLITIESYLDKERKILENIFDRSSEGTLIEEAINNSYSGISLVDSKVKAWSWRTRNEKDKHYIITVDSEDNYNFLLRRDALELPAGVDLQQMTFKFTIDGNTFEQKAESIDDTWILIRKIKLDKGFHKMTFELDPPELFKESDNREEVPFIEFENGVYTLRASGDRNCTTFPVHNLIPGFSYRVSFKHRRLSGEQNLQVFVEEKEKKLLPLTRFGDDVRVSPYFVEYRQDKYLTDSNELFISICSEFFRDLLFSQNTVIEIQDLSVKKLSAPIFIFEKEILTRSGQNKQKVIFNKINQTKYKIHVVDAKNPFFLTFSQRFSPDWKIYEDKTATDSFLGSFLSPSGFFSISNLLRDELPEKYHFISNGYANSWYIDKTGSYDIILEYEPQLWRYIAIIISLLTIFVTLWFSIKKEGSR